ncbi:MAG: methyltransferase domain-containing protein [FCB group bacterium]|nr:methyltransferase domain-containing protein [FCB group bacterium]
MNKTGDVPQFWEEKYQSGKAYWDLGGPTPVFEELAAGLNNGRVCIIGSGRGYDAIVFAKRGLEVTIVDFAPSAIEAAEREARKAGVTIIARQMDLFYLPGEYSDEFDYVIEQTCFCAIDPGRRREYENVVWRILKTGGKLIGLWFPIDKNHSSEGPPWSVSVAEIKRLFGKRWELEREEFPELSIKPRKGREKLMIFRKLPSLDHFPDWS